MLLKLFGLLDLAAAFVVLFLGLSIGMGRWLLILFVIYLVLKGLIYFSVIGLIDVLVGIVVLLFMVGAGWAFLKILAFASAVWLAQKGFLSLVR